MTSPRAKFHESKETVAFWLELVTKASFLRGLDTALLQMQSELPDSDDPVTSAARFQRLKGARRVLDILVGLPEIAKERTPLPDINLKPVK